MQPRPRPCCAPGHSMGWWRGYLRQAKDAERNGGLGGSVQINQALFNQERRNGDREFFSEGLRGLLTDQRAGVPHCRRYGKLEAAARSGLLPAVDHGPRRLTGPARPAGAVTVTLRLYRLAWRWLGSLDSGSGAVGIKFARGLLRSSIPRDLNRQPMSWLPESTNVSCPKSLPSSLAVLNKVTSRTS